MIKKKNPTNEVLKAAGMPATKRPKVDFRTAGVTRRANVKKKVAEIVSRKPIGPDGIRKLKPAVIKKVKPAVRKGGIGLRTKTRKNKPTRYSIS